MDSLDNLTTLLSCFFFMSLVGYISYRKTKGDVGTIEGYFLANRGLNGIFIAGSLLLTNLSSEHFIGLNGSAYGFNLSSMAWEVTAAIATIFMALIFLPLYLKGAYTTLPEFISNRFDNQIRRMLVVLFMIGYGLVTIPAVLYSGSVAILMLFDIENIFHITYGQAMISTIILIGTIGGFYAVFGGLKAVAISDTLNGVGLLIIGILVPILGFKKLGNGSIISGFQIITTQHTEKLNAIGSSNDPTPFGTIFTGMIFANLFYWCTNQYVIQRTLGAKNLKEGQKGVLISGFFKVFIPFIMMIPGVITFHLYGPSLTSIDLAYPKLIRDVLPNYATGFFLAVLLGAVLSSFNSLLNSAATLFCLDIYIPFKKEKVNDKKILQVAKLTSLIIALCSFVVAPLLRFAPDGLFQIIRIFTGFYNIPVIAIVIIGLFNKNVPALGPKIVVVFHIISYGVFQFLLKDYLKIHFIHLYAILFLSEILIMLLIGKIFPEKVHWEHKNKDVIDLTPWKYVQPVSFTLFSAVILIYLIFSPLGFVGGGPGLKLVFLISLLVVINIFFWFYKLKPKSKIK